MMDRGSLKWLMNEMLRGKNKMRSSAFANFILKGQEYLGGKGSDKTRRLADSLLHQDEIAKCVVEIDLHGQPFFFNLMRLGFFELDMIHDKVVTRDTYGTNLLTSKEPVIFDLGAHIGYYSRHVLFTAPKARLISVEPDHDNFDLLKRNLLPYQNAKFFQVGIHGHKGKMEFLVSSKNDIRSSLKTPGEWRQEGFDQDEFSSPYSVDITDIDSLYTETQPGKVDLLKITVPGEIELEILKGAEKTIRECKPQIAIFSYKKNYHLVDLYLAKTGNYKRIKNSMGSDSPFSVNIYKIA